MTYTNEELLAQLDQAFKGITDVTALGESVLATQKFDRFVKAMQARTAIINEARFIKMLSQITDIDRVGFAGRILQVGTSANEEHVNLTEEQFAKPAFHTNKLEAREMQAIVGLRDRALRRNIERGGFENTLIDLFGEAAGRDLEEWAIFANLGSPDPVLALTDGWMSKAAGTVSGLTIENDAEEVLAALLEALPKQFLVNRAEWRFYVPYFIEDGYRNILKQRNTALGDAAQTTGMGLMYKGIPVRYVPMLERYSGTDVGVAMLQHPDNMVWGLFHEVTIEREREAKARRTDFVLTVEADAHYEDENAAVVTTITNAAG